DTLGGEDAFKLHDTYGVFIDITEQMAAESGLKVDRAGYQELMDQAKRKAREAQKKHIVTAVSGELPKTDDEAKYNSGAVTAKMLGWVSGNEVVRTGKLAAEESVALLVDRTNFYAEAGGQVGDSGTITTAAGRFDVDDTQRLGDAVLHFGQISEVTIEVGQTATLRVDGIRLD